MKLALSLVLLLLSLVGAQAQSSGTESFQCGQTFQVSQAATALTKIVTGVGSGKVISLCGLILNAGAATATAQLEYGTGTNCGTGTTVITPSIQLGINGVFAFNGEAFYSLPKNTDLCLVTTGTGPMAVMVLYGQN